MIDRAKIQILGVVAIAVFAASLVSTTTALATKSELWHSSDVDERIIELGRNENQVTKHLKHLANQIGARPAGSQEHHETAEWLLEKFENFGLANVHLEWSGDYPGNPDADWARDSLGHFIRLDDKAGKILVPLFNVVADIPGTENPDQYVIVGAHYDSVPVGSGALDNGTGVAAALEAARILLKSGAQPKRTIRFVLFAGEESGLIGSRAYVDSHPDLLPQISAMYNMDLGTHYISGITVTDPLKDDMEAIFAPLHQLHADMPFEIKVTEWLKALDSGACGPTIAGGGCGSPSAACGDGPTPVLLTLEERPDGSLVPTDLPESFDMNALLEKLEESDSEPGDGPVRMKLEDLQALGLVPEGATLKTCGGGGEGEPEFALLMIGSSDHAPFLEAGLPGLWWTQRGDESVKYPAHSAGDTYDAVVPRYLEHSATVIALGALGTANLDHMLSREKLTRPGNDLAQITQESR